jgi:pimeloyl-ACP methyl ester carboxylesterase
MRWLLLVLILQGCAVTRDVRMEFISLDFSGFSRAYGHIGFWWADTFQREERGGVYLLEPYDRERIPVLFIHGATGTPQDWRYFIEHLDRAKYQPWVYHYASGLPLEESARQLERSVAALHREHGFKRLVVTAHSMGGLVARRFASRTPDYMTLLITFVTPWGGVPAAQLGTDWLPHPVPSWRDLSPDSDFLRALEAEPLPAGVEHHLFFAYQDQLVTLRSQLEHPGSAELHGIEETHGGILRSERAFRVYAGLLEDFN